MPRNRVIKVDFWDDEKLSTISRDARLVFIALWNFSDDYGVVKGNSIWLKNHIFPYEPNVTPQAFQKWLTELEDIHVIIPFEADNCEKYYLIKSFSKHQTVNRPSSQRNPVPHGALTESSMSAPLPLILEREREREREEEGIKNASRMKPKQKKAFSPPTEDEVVAYFNDNGYSESAARKAFQYYDTANWKDSRGNSVKNWKQKMIAVWFKPENEQKPETRAPSVWDREAGG